MLGYPSTFQGPNHDFRMQAEAKSQNVQLTDVVEYNDRPNYMDNRKKEIEQKAKDWILLFQLASETEAEMNWCDAGILYFLIKKQDLKKLNFNN